jgi:STE24 endopeptidase
MINNAIVINGLLISFLSVFALSALLRWCLGEINIRHVQRHGHTVPDVFRGEIDAEILGKMSDYTVESSRFGRWESLCEDALTLAIILTGLLSWLAAVVGSFGLPFIPSGLLFLGALTLISSVAGLPLSYYQTFVIEKKYGFSTISLGLWITDLFKSLMISLILLGSLLTALLALMDYSPHRWWLLVWLVFAFFQLMMLYLYPVVIAPLFNKYEKIKDEELREAIVNLMARVGLKTEGVYQMDAGKRSRHTNAYFTGLGKTKRIVLYDTLLTSHTSEEILSVLAHEIGHWRKRHILKQLILMEVLSLVVFYLISRFVEWPYLYQTFGFAQNLSYAGLFLATALLGPVAFLLTPFGTAIMRRFEREADEFAYTLTGTVAPLCNALKRLAKDNLSNLHPHPLYAWFYYSHPPLTERIAHLQHMERENSP